MAWQWEAFKGAAEELQGDQEIVRLAVSKCWLALAWAREPATGDRDIVMTAVSQSGMALHHASPPPERPTISMRPISRGHACRFSLRNHVLHVRLKFQKNPHVRNLSARNSGAGNGCANFMGAWHFLVLSAGKLPCP